MKRGLIVSFSIALCIILCFVMIFTVPIKTGSIFKDEPQVSFSTQGKYILAHSNNKKTKFEIKGVTIGQGYPGVITEESKIKKSVYSKWFEKIAQMNANTIYVDVFQSPEFYVALKKYNDSHDKKLYIIQSISLQDDFVYSDKNILTRKGLEEIFKTTEDVIDAIHGNNLILDSKTKSLYCYYADVSEYVVAYMVGNAWDEVFVEYTNKINANMKNYIGKFFACDKKASPFENLLAMWADFAVEHEAKTYNEKHIISFFNTVETDPLINDIKLSDTDLEPSIDVNHIYSTSKNTNGFIESYCVQPYYPLFLQVGPYTKFVDENGKKNSYRKYLAVLNEYTRCPIVISGFGVSSSRSTTHYDYLRGFSHGGLNETEQAYAYRTLYEDINKAGCAGAVTIAWQDEWRKSTWNEKNLSQEEGKAFWCNVQSSELFGLMSFEPDEKYNIYPDNDFSEWKKDDIVMKNSKFNLSMKSDFKFLHIMVDGLDMNKVNGNYINIPLDISPDYGACRVAKLNFEYSPDFIIKISKNGTSALYVSRDYDVLAYSILNLFENKSIGGLAQLKQRYAQAHTPLETSRYFNIVSRADENTFSILSTKNEISNVGVLKEGNGNPQSKNYNSNADYYIEDNKIHIRIPWQLLNFYNPSKCEIIDDFAKNGYALKGKEIGKIYVGAYYDDDIGKCDMKPYKLKKYNKPKIRERMKPAYYEMQKAFGGAAS